jgi:hypothetical protein
MKIQRDWCNSSETITVFTKYQCTKHCTIKLPDEQLYTSCSLGTQTKRNTLNTCTTSSNDVSNAEENTKPVNSLKYNPNLQKHTLTFKVLGTCFSKERQVCLERAYHALH